MEAGESRSCRRRPGRRWLPLLLVLLTGCASSLAQIHRALLAHPDAAARNENPVTVYTVACPDVLEIQVTGRPELCGRREIGPDGRIDLGSLGRLRVEDLAIPDIAGRVARAAGVAQTRVGVQVVEYHSKQVFVSGQVVGLQHVVAYRGPETVLDLLQRVGGISSGAAPDEVYVVRSHLRENRQPEVFRVNLRAILMKHDSRTNVYVEPLDQVFVGETRPCSLERCLPPWVRPLYESFWGLRAKDDKTAK